MEDAVILSPLPKILSENKIMDFYEALKKLALGERITRLEWGDKNEYGLLLDGKVCIHTKGNLHQWVISDGDLAGTDWVTLSSNPNINKVV